MKNKYSALKPEYNLKTRYEEISDLNSYMHKLNDKEKEWLNKFSEEYVNASFDSNPKKRLHKTKKLQKDCYDRNNARNRCILTKSNASGKTVGIDKAFIEETTEDEVSIEDLIDIEKT